MVGNAIGISSCFASYGAAGGLGGLVAWLGLADSTKVEICWKELDDEVTGYRVERASASGGPYSDISGILPPSANPTQCYTDTPPDTAVYYYQVVAISEADTSNEVAGRKMDPPDAPVLVAATGGVTSISLTWQAQADVDKYSVWRSETSGGPYTFVADTAGSATGYVDMGPLVTGREYFYVVDVVRQYVTGGTVRSNEDSAIPQSTITASHVLTLDETGYITQSAADFDDANEEYLTVDSNAALAVTDEDFYLSAWVRFDDATGTRSIASKGEDGADYALGLTSTVFEFVCNGSKVADSGLTVQADTWYFLLAWHDSVADTINLRVNDRDPVSAAHSTGPFESSDPFRVGTSDTGEMIFTIETTGASEVFTLPLTNLGTHDSTVFWGDGDSDAIGAWDDVDKAHTYANAGTYQITIRGLCGGFQVNEAAPTATQIQKIDKVGNVGLVAFNVNGCANIGNDSLSSRMFAGNVATLTTMSGAFKGTSVSETPVDFLADLVNVTTFTQLLSNAPIATVNAGIFKGCSAVTDYSSCFAGNTTVPVQAFPENLFTDSPNVTTFYRAFWRCRGMTTIPANMFNVTASCTFGECFGDTRIVNCPGDVFANCPNATVMSQLFFSDTALETVGSGLFASCPNVTTFANCFNNCTSLNNVPGDIFSAALHPNVTTFSSTFRSCTSHTANLPTLWIEWPEAPPPTPTDCFFGCSNAANYGSVPTAWGGA
jgi:hypothetical protein